MKCILIPRHGEDIDNLTCSENFPSPARKAGQVLVKVQACALAPGDIRVMKGHCDYFQSPRGFPCIPGGDITSVASFKRQMRTLRSHPAASGRSSLRSMSYPNSTVPV